MPQLLAVRHGTSDLKVISERPMIFTSECCILGEWAITTYFKHLRFDKASTTAGLKLRTSWISSESTTTRLFSLHDISLQLTKFNHNNYIIFLRIEEYIFQYLYYMYKLWEDRVMKTWFDPWIHFLTFP
jgi:hypothetical protein